MIGLLILTQGTTGLGLVEAAEHIFGMRPPRLEALVADTGRRSPAQLAERLRGALARLDQGRGVLILADLFGASYTNLACRFVEKGRVELLAGVNLPMLVRAINHRHLALAALAEKARSGGVEGIVRAAPHPQKPQLV